MGSILFILGVMGYAFDGSKSIQENWLIVVIFILLIAKLLGS